jgi:AcrR family transcriptional regulator
MVQRGQKRNDGIETIALIKKFALKELDKYGSVQFNLDRVLRLSGISRGSVYHHFGSRDGLLSTLELETSLTRTLEELALVRQLVEAATTRREMLDTFAIGFSAGDNAATRQRRLRRIASIAASEKNRALTQALHDAQIVGTEEFVSIIRLAEQKGLVQLSSSAEGTAYLLQSMLLGRVLVDISASTEAQEKWMQSTLVAIKALLGLSDVTDN